MPKRTLDSLFGRKPREKTIMWIQDHLPDAKLPSFADSRRALNVGVGVNSPLWPTFIAAAGAGAAFWWWTQWARGRAEIEAREAAAVAEGARDPETVMAHAPAPAPAGAAPVDVSDADLEEPAQDLMAHTPPIDASPAVLGAAAGLDGPLPDSAVAAVDESLGVQGDPAKKPRRPGKKAEAVPAVTH